MVYTCIQHLGAGSIVRINDEKQCEKHCFSTINLIQYNLGYYNVIENIS